ncbi:MAG: hypothetical protein KKB50_00255 [Planctomycetes bacterium]|nr:hypothetical protein [Planctomycetota bacterium]
MQTRSKSFWTKELLTDYPKCEAICASPDVAVQFRRMTQPSFAAVCSALSVDEASVDGATLEERCQEIFKNRKAALLQLVLLIYFELGKRKIAIRKVAEDRLSPADLAACQSVSGELDTLAAVIRLFEASPDDLVEVLLRHVDDCRGHAPLLLAPKTRIAKDGFAKWCTAAKVRRALKGNADVHRIQAVGGRSFVLLQANADRASVRVDGDVVYGYHPQWILLNFAADPNGLRASGKSIKDAATFATALIRAFTKKRDLEYVDEKVLTPRDKVAALLKALKLGEDERLPLVELKVAETFLKGAPTVTLAGQESLAEGLQDLDDRLPYSLLRDPQKIASFKVLFRKHRVGIKLDWVDASCVVRYADSRLTGDEKDEFVKHLQDDYKIKVISTEKKSSA